MGEVTRRNLAGSFRKRFEWNGDAFGPEQSDPYGGKQHQDRHQEQNDHVIVAIRHSLLCERVVILSFRGDFSVQFRYMSRRAEHGGEGLILVGPYTSPDADPVGITI